MTAMGDGGGALAGRFARFAAEECWGVSPLYQRLAEGVAGDPEVLAIAARTRPGQPVPNALVAAVHALLQAGPADPLASHYPSVSTASPPTDDPYPAFHRFCLEHRQEIVDLVETRLIQTNEVRRCACLLPALGLVARAGGGRPLALLEVGASAGLNLLWDRYGFDYGSGVHLGDLGSPVQLRCAVRGGMPALLPEMPLVGSRVGIGLNPIDPRDPAAVAWLRALVWPDQPERAALLEAALTLARRDPPRLIAGDALMHLAPELAAVPESQTPCVMHTHTLNQFSPEARARLEAVLCHASRGRRLWRVGIEGRRGVGHAVLEVGREDLAHCDGHGEWIRWLVR